MPKEGDELVKRIVNRLGKARSGCRRGSEAGGKSGLIAGRQSGVVKQERANKKGQTGRQEMAAGIKKLFRGAEEGIAERKFWKNWRKVGNTKAGNGRRPKKIRAEERGRNPGGNWEMYETTGKRSRGKKLFFRFVRRFFGRAENERRDDGDQDAEENKKSNLRGRH